MVQTPPKKNKTMNTPPQIFAASDWVHPFIPFILQDFDRPNKISRNDIATTHDKIRNAHIIITTPVFPRQQIDHLKAACSLVALSARVDDISFII